MNLLLKLITKNSLFVFFFLLQIIALYLMFTKVNMQKSFLASQINAFNSKMESYVDEGTNYLKLKKINEQLVGQNKQLMTELYGKNHSDSVQFVKVTDTAKGGQIYNFVDADVKTNSINKKDNYFSINRGTLHGVFPEMGVIATNGIAGIVINSTKNYALVQSVLSTNKIRINASLKKTGNFGTLTWNGDDSRVMHLSDIPKYVSVLVGDSVITDSKSSIFPQGIFVGRISGYSIDPTTGFWDISVELAQNMSNLNKVYVVKNLKKSGLKKLTDSL